MPRRAPLPTGPIEVGDQVTVKAASVKRNTPFVVTGIKDTATGKTVVSVVGEDKKFRAFYLDECTLTKKQVAAPKEEPTAQRPVRRKR